MKKNKNYSLVFVSILLSIFLIEIFFHLKNYNIKKNYKFSLHNYRFMLFDQGLIFKNQGSIFKYHPNKKILSKTFYYVNDKWNKEYEYEIVTNNFGLVQKDNLRKEVPSILFLGDSFVEGQGSYAWINKFNGRFKNLQIINGGIMGTGPQQFELMEEHISKEYQIKKLIFFYIGDDFRRNIFNISKNTLSCLSDYNNCTGSENFYGYPLKQKNPQIFLEKLSNFRIQQNESASFYEKSKNRVKIFFLNLNTIKIVNNFLRQRFYNSNNKYIKSNFQSIKNLYSKYGDSILFVQLKNKNEIIYGKEYDTFYAEKFIKSLSSRHFECNFDDDITNFHSIDMHPNEKGYNNLFNCVENILVKNL